MGHARFGDVGLAIYLWDCITEDPQCYLADVLSRIVNGHPNGQIDDLLPWAYIAHEFNAVA